MMRFLSTLLAFLCLSTRIVQGIDSSPKVTAELLEEVSDSPLKIKGIIPVWLKGTLVRNGPITVSVNGESNLHWFDGLAMLHGFAIDGGKVNYTNRFLRSEAYDTVFKSGSIHYIGFASDPCRLVFKNYFVFFMPDYPTTIHNANVNVAKMADAYVALTEIPLPVKFDSKTLDTLGVLNYQDQLPKSRCWESAHPHHDIAKKETLNYLVQFGMNSHYIVHKMEDGSSERKIIAEIPVREPSYMHSFAVTENYVILTEYPFVVKPLDLITKGKPFITNYTWKPEKGTRFTVVDRHTGQVVAKSETTPFFAFHHANAFEKEGQLYLDIVTYADATIITGSEFYLNTKDVVYESVPTKLERFSLPVKGGEIARKTLLEQWNEFPRINNHFDGLPYQYVYLVGFGKTPFSKEDVIRSDRLFKVNTTSNEVLEWSQKGCSPGEPVFVATPGSQIEDDGVILSVVLDHDTKSSFLLVLDSKSFKEIARAEAPHLIPTGLHGQFFAK